MRSKLIAVFLAWGALAAGMSNAAAADSGRTFRSPFNTEKTPGGPESAAAAAAAVEVPPGFRTILFAGEPDVAQPIALATDTRGRLWVAENNTYAERAVGFADELRDRIIIFDDVDNDGTFDRRTVFFDRAQRLTSIELDAGGVWALCPPHLLFIPDRDGDDVPDGEPEIVLDGFDYLKSQHNIANGLRWGPDGWLYGRQGILGHSRVGPPGAPLERRVPINVGIWRFHPVTRVFEPVAQGTTNPWGMDWDARGEGFFINTVIGHLWHLIPGAHYRRMFGDDPSPNVFDVIEQHADHFHWATAEDWKEVRKGVSTATLQRGGGHAHTGVLIYQGGSWPAEWNGKLLTINFHGRRINVDCLEPHGSGYVGRHENDAFVFSDPWFRGIDLLAAPDGNVFVSDWSDAGECHDADGVHRLSGRIYKLAFGKTDRRENFDLTRLPDLELARLQRSTNDWLARYARREMVHRVRRGESLTAAHRELRGLLAGDGDSVHRLRALWALYVTGAPLEQYLPSLIRDSSADVRAWAVRLLTDRRPLALSEQTRELLTERAAKEPSARVRLALASAVHAIPLAQRVPLLSALLARGEDSLDHNLPKLLWYALSPVADLNQSGFEQAIARAAMPMVQRFGARRLAEEIDTAPAGVNALLVEVARSGAATNIQAVLDGVADGLAGRRKAPAPAAWPELRPKFAAMADPEMTARLRDLDALFGDGRALGELRARALDSKLDPRLRREALQAVIDARAEGFVEICERLLPVSGLSGTAAAGLALSADAEVATKLLHAWNKFDGADRPRVVGVLVSRPPWAERLLEAIAARRVPKNHLNAFHARQIRAYRDPRLNELLARAWGEVPDETDPSQRRLLETWQARLAPSSLSVADRQNGRKIFRQICAACHTLNGEGGKLGPDLTGAARDNLNYLLENLLFPSALVADEFKLTTVTLRDSRVLAGMVRGRSSRTLRLQTTTDLVTLVTDDILREDVSTMSLMPPGLLESLRESDARDLIVYLMATERDP